MPDTTPDTIIIAVTPEMIQHLVLEDGNITFPVTIEEHPFDLTLQFVQDSSNVLEEVTKKLNLSHTDFRQVSSVHFKKG